MSPQAIGWLSIVAVFALLFMGVPVAFGLFIIGFVGYFIVAGPDPAFGIIGTIPYTKMTTYTFSVIPLFLLMGNLAYKAGFGADVYKSARYWLGRLPGGLAQATVAGCAAFGAACGSGIATCAMMTKIAVPEMERYGYDRRLAFGAVASAGPIAQMIPPSILMVIYGVITEQSIARLLIAGIFPGILTALVFMAGIYVMARKNPHIAPPLEKVSWKESFAALRYGWAVGLLALIIMGGIYSGVFTPTEAGGVAAFAALVLALVTRRLSLRHLGEPLADTMRTTGMVFLIIAGAFVFGALLAITGIPAQLSSFITKLPVPPILILFAVMLLYLVLGCFLDMIAAMFLTLPIIFPAMMHLGYDPIWFGVLMVHLCEIALLTPPYGLNLFVIKGVRPDAKMGDIIRGVGVFVLMDVVTLTLLILFPEIALFLPRTMMGGG